MYERNSKTGRRWVGLAASVALCPAWTSVCTAGNQSDPAPGTIALRDPQALKLVAVVLDTSVGDDERRAAMTRIGELPDRVRVQAHKAVVAAGPADDAYTAASALIMAGALESADVIWLAFPKWTHAEQAGILGRIPSASNPGEFLSLPRRALGQIAQSQSRTDRSDFTSAGLGGDVVRVSAQLLKRSRHPHDVSLVRESIRLAPASMSAWYAVASQAEVPPEICEHALTVMNDSTLPDRVRMAAAVVASREHEEGSQFVSRILAALVLEYRGDTVRAMIPAGEWSSPRYATFQQDLVMLHAALLAPREGVEEAVFDALAGRNEQLAIAAMHIAARRWPERVLAMIENGALGANEVPTAAVLASYHPKMMAEIEEAAGIGDIDRELQKLHKTNPWWGSDIASQTIFGLLDNNVLPAD